MAPKKSQEESEQPAKVYQLDAVQSQVDAIEKQVREGFKSTNDSLQALLIKSDSQVTPQQLSDNMAAMNKTIDNKVREEVEKIHLEYGPIKENNKWLIRAIVTEAIIIVGQAVIVFSAKGT